MPKPFTWTRAKIAQLGNVPDAVLAERWGLGVRQVKQKRRALGIHLTPAARGRSGRRLTVVPPERAALLGTCRDEDLADAWGMPVSTVRAIRARLGIPPLGNRGRMEAASARWRERILAVLGDSPVPMSVGEIAEELRARGWPGLERHVRWRVVELARTGHVESAAGEWTVLQRVPASTRGASGVVSGPPPARGSGAANRAPRSVHHARAASISAAEYGHSGVRSTTGGDAQRLARTMRTGVRALTRATPATTAPNPIPASVNGSMDTLPYSSHAVV
jgi:hypothetical protein